MAVYAHVNGYFMWTQSCVEAPLTTLKERGPTAGKVQAILTTRLRNVAIQCCITSHSAFQHHLFYHCKKALATVILVLKSVAYQFFDSVIVDSGIEPLYQKQRNRSGLNNRLDCLDSWYA